MSDKPSWSERIQSASDLYNAFDNLPPRYDTSEDLDFPQVISDPVSTDDIRRAMDNVDKAEKR